MFSLSRSAAELQSNLSCAPRNVGQTGFMVIRLVHCVSAVTNALANELVTAASFHWLAFLKPDVYAASGWISSLAHCAFPLLVCSARGLLRGGSYFLLGMRLVT